VQKEAVNSAAMQDHLMKKFKVGHVDPFRPAPLKGVKKPPVGRAASGQL